MNVMGIKSLYDSKKMVVYLAKNGNDIENA